MNKNEIIFFILIALLLLCVVIYVFPTLDCFSIPVNRFGTLYVFSSVICTSSNNIITNIIGTMIFFIIMFIMAFKKENMIKVALIASPNIIWIGWIGCSGGWHIGILFLIIVFISIITNSINTKKSIYILFWILIIIHIYWNITCSINDIKEWKDKIDVMILCGGSATDLPFQIIQSHISFGLENIIQIIFLK